MSINRDLFLSILSLDAYNRGYNPGIKFESASTEDGLGTGT